MEKKKVSIKLVYHVNYISSYTCNFSFQALFVPYNAAFIDHCQYNIPVRYPASKRARMV
jgi:hypothetical protein